MSKDSSRFSLSDPINFNDRSSGSYTQARNSKFSRANTIEKTKNNSKQRHTFLCFINRNEFKQIQRSTWGLFRSCFELDPLTVFMKENSSIPTCVSELPEDDPTKPTLLLSIDFNHLLALNNSPTTIKANENETHEYVDGFLQNGLKLSNFYKIVKKRYKSLRYFVVILDNSIKTKTKLALMEFYCRYDNEVNLLIVDSRDKLEDFNDMETVDVRISDTADHNGDFKMNEIYKAMVTQSLIRMPFSNDLEKKNSVSCRRPLECDPVPKL